MLLSSLNAQFFGKAIKINCTDCQNPMRKTISRYVCFDNHTNVKKSEFVMDENGTWSIKQKERIESVERKYGPLFYVGALLISGSGLMGLYMNNFDCNDCTNFEDYVENSKKSQ